VAGSRLAGYCQNGREPGGEHVRPRGRQAGHGPPCLQVHRPEALEHLLQLRGREARVGIVEVNPIGGGDHGAGRGHGAAGAHQRNRAAGVEGESGAGEGARHYLLDAAPLGGAKRRGRIGYAALGQTHAAEGKTGRLEHLAVANLQTFEAASTEVEDLEIAPSTQSRIGGESAPDQVGFLFAGEDAQLMAAGGLAQALAELGAVGGVAHRTGGNDGELLRGKPRGLVEQAAHGGGGGGHPFLGELGAFAADSRADPGLVGGGKQDAQMPVFVAVGDKQFDGVAAEIDDGHGRAHVPCRLGPGLEPRRAAVEKMFRQALTCGPDSTASMLIGALFDWDGVIIDSARQHAESWERLAAEEGRVLPENHFRLGFGMKNERIIPDLLGWTNDPAEIRRLSLRKEALYREIVVAEGTVALPGVREFLDRLLEAGVPCAIGSSTHRENIATILGVIGLADRFACVVTAEDVGQGKPDPEVFLKSAAGIRREPAQCVVFEDAIAGLEAARRGGMRAIGVATTHPASALGLADRVVRRLDELAVADLVALVHGGAR
jgi:HAD superfamily hydrolase (TIGR01509 family)